ncbi:MAG: alpha/beta fold hydrolase [Planctomycetota bacterium]|jgi:uncharacterized protein|nr:alpha/beta fold hydrolase [Planctomycetota bacterium]
MSLQQQVAFRPPGGESLEMDAFQPHPLLRGFHRMTLAPMFFRRDVKHPMPLTEKRVFEVDGQTSVLGLCSWQAERSPVLVMMHGFAGHADRPYMRGTARKAFASGFHVVRLNMRNCGGTEHLAGSMYHAGLVSDLLAVIHALRSEPLCGPVHLAGFSMGGNVVLRLGGLLGQRGCSDVRSLVAVSPVIDLAHCADNLDQQRSVRVYRKSFLRGLRAVYNRRARLSPERYEPGRLAGVRTLRAFDELVTAPDCGFENADDYYSRASSRWELQNLRIPSLVLHSQDDLIVPLSQDQLEELEAAPMVTLLKSQHGGHCGFVAGRVADSDADRYWAENRLVEYVNWIERTTTEVEVSSSHSANQK